MDILYAVLNILKPFITEIVLCILSIVAFICVFAYLRKNKPYKAATNHWFMICTVGLFIIIIYSLEKYEHFAQIDTWISIADNILSGSIFAILCFFFWRYERKIKNKYEDKEKLTVSYEELTIRYSKDKLVKIKNADESTIVYPVIEMGNGHVSLFDKNCGRIIIEDNMEERYQLPAIIENNFSKIFNIHDTSNVFNSLNIRVKDMKLDNNVLLFKTGRTTYYDSLVTNRASDYEFEEKLSVRKLYEMGPQMNKLEISRLSNHLGFNGFIESADGYIVFVKRSEKMSIGKGTYGDSIGASLKSAYALDKNGVFTANNLKKAIIKEVENELKIAKEDLDESSLSIIAIYRDCVECGKPQFLMYAKSKKNARDINDEFDKNEKEKKVKNEVTSQLERDQIDLEVAEDGAKLLWMKKKCLKEHIIYTINSIKFDGASSEEGFVEFKNGTKKKSKVQELNMVPSASASVVMFLNTIKLPKICETFVMSKSGNLSDCEDGIYIGKDVIAVIDGCTSKSDKTVYGMKSGLYAKNLICEALEEQISTDSPKEFFTALNNYIKNAVENNPECKREDFPRASVIAYIPSKNEVWSYGDCRCIVNNELHTHEKKIDIKLAKKRAKEINELLKKDKTIEDLAERDFGREAISKYLLKQIVFENVHKEKKGKDYGYPVLNGDKICDDMICVYKVDSSKEVVLATDGYPELKNSLDESEKALSELLKKDPYCYKSYKSTKGLQKGNISFDDRAYIRFTV